MTTLADIVREHGPSYLRLYGDRLLKSHRKALQAIVECHTPVLGGHRYHCEDCGADHYRYHSCRNRACPACQNADREAWVNRRLRDLLPGRYFHLVFTVPQELRSPIRSHQRELLSALMQAAAESLKTLAADPKHLGGKIAALQVLHTWGATLEYHPHVHCLIPGGALDQSLGCWRSSRQKFLLPVRALSRLFRGAFLAEARRRLPELALPDSLYRKEWAVYCKSVVNDPKRVVEYLGRYIHRSAISNGRILAMRDGLVTFAYRDYRLGKKRVMTVSAHEFLRRFLQHVLPRGFHRVRYLGLFSPACRRSFLALQATLWRLAGLSFPMLGEVPIGAVVCPSCNSENVTRHDSLPRMNRGPPNKYTPGSSLRVASGPFTLQPTNQRIV